MTAPDHPPRSHDEAFDAFARDAHAASLAHLSPRVSAQLAQRRRAALAPAARAARPRAWPMLALGSAAVLTLAVGVFVLRTDPIGRTPGAVAVAPAPAVGSALPAPSHDATPSPATGEAIAPREGPGARPAMPADTRAAGAPVAGVPVAGTLAVKAPAADVLAIQAQSADAAMGFDTLNESPDFYLWLASEDGLATVTETL